MSGEVLHWQAIRSAGPRTFNAGAPV